MRGPRIPLFFGAQKPAAFLLGITLTCSLLGCPGGSQVRTEQNSLANFIPERPALSASSRPVQTESPVDVGTVEEVVADVDSANQVVQSHVNPIAQSCSDQQQASAQEARPPSGNGSLNEGLLNQLVEQAYQSDKACRRVFTGNQGNYSLDPTLGYARTFAKSFAQDMCSPLDEEVFRVQSAAAGNPATDALARRAFSKYLPTSKQNGSLENLAATYRLSYALSFRESSGNFQEGRDRSANNTSYDTEEAGAFQVSSNTLDYSRSDPEGVRARRRVFAHFLSTLAAAKSAGSRSQMTQVCDLRPKSELPRGNRELETNRDYISDSMFSEGQPCAELSAFIQGDPTKLRVRSKDRGVCFMQLQKRCPAFAIKYNTVTTRTRADHFGPLKIRSDGRNFGGKQPPRPQCRAIFDVLIENRDRVCGGHAAGNVASALGSSKASDSSVTPPPRVRVEDDGGLPQGTKPGAVAVIPPSKAKPANPKKMEADPSLGGAGQLKVVDDRKMPGVTRSYGGRGRRSLDAIKYIKIDSSAATQSGEDLARSSNVQGHPFGYHFIIDKDGTIRQTADVQQITQGLSSKSRKGFFSKAGNSNTIHISLAGTDNDKGAGQAYLASEPFGTLPSTPEQKAALEKLYRELVGQMPQLQGQVFGHGEVSTNRHPDEGRIEAEFLRSLEASSAN